MNLWSPAERTHSPRVLMPLAMGRAVFVAGDEPSDPFTWRATLESL